MGRRAACVVEMAAENKKRRQYVRFSDARRAMYNVLYNVDTLGRRRKEYRKECGEAGHVQAGDAPSQRLSQGLDGIHQRDLWWVFMSSVGPPSLVITPSLSISAKPDGISRIQPERDPSGGEHSRAVFFVETKLLEIWTYIHTLAQ